MLQDKIKKNKLKQIITAAEKKNIVTKEEIGFIVAIVEKFRSDLDKKVRQQYLLQGEIAQLRSNEQIIINLIENMIVAAERESKRQEDFIKLREEDDLKSNEEEKKQL